MDLSTFATALSTMGLGIAAAAWLIRKLIGQFLDKDLEAFKAAIRRDGERELESLRSNLQLEAQKRIIEFGSLHAKRAELVAELYGKLSHLRNCINILPHELSLRGYKEEYGQLEPFQLSPSEAISVDKLSLAWRDFVELYEVKKIYLSVEAIGQLDTFLKISGFISGNYHNVAFKDANGAALVDASVRQTWDESFKVLPTILSRLEQEFRSLIASA